MMMEERCLEGHVLLREGHNLTYNGAVPVTAASQPSPAFRLYSDVSSIYPPITG